jgi:hypothetical protein
MLSQMFTLADKFAIFVLLMGMLAYQVTQINIMVQLDYIYVDKSPNSSINTQPLIYDVVYAWFPYYPSLYSSVATPVAATLGIFTIFLSLIKRQYFAQIWLIWGLGTLFRSLTMSLTRLPLTSYDLESGTCLPYIGMDLWPLAYNVFIYGYNCGDYFFSEHTYTILTALVFIYKVFKSRVIRWIVTMVSLIAIFTLLLSHAHYSIDVIGAITTLHITYHTIPHIITYINSFEHGHHNKDN